MNEFKLYLAGEWAETKSGKIADDINPATGKLFARVHTAGPEEIEKALAAAEAAQPAWAALLPEEREAVLLRAADYLAANMERMCTELIEETGSCFMKAMGELAECVNVFRTAAGECRRVDGGVVPADIQGQLSFYVRLPVGVVLGIGPFNYPFLLSLNKVALALAAGNAMILKPASDSPRSGLLIAECLDAAGLPKGLFSVLPGPGGTVGDALVRDPRIKMIAFTGSTQAGSEIAVKAAQHGKRCALEMGGKNPIIVLNDADLEKAATIALFGAYFHQGQICMATSRVIVEDGVYDKFAEIFEAKVRALRCGDPHSPETIIGPLIRESQCAVLDEHIRDACEKGAKLVCGGTHEGAFYAPSLLADVTPDMKVFHEESFGPLTSLIRAKDAEDALRLCNLNTYGLSAAICTQDVSKAMSYAMRMEAGMVHINDSTVMGSRRAPFGGVKASGIGREDSSFSVEEFTVCRWITLQYGERGYPV